MQKGKKKKLLKIQKEIFEDDSFSYEFKIAKLFKAELHQHKIATLLGITWTEVNNKIKEL